MKRFLFLIAGLMMGGTTVFGATSTEGRTGLLPLGSQMPRFSMPDVVSGRTITNEDFKDKKVVMVAFICRHCPYVQHIKKSLGQIGRDYADKSVAIVAISANDPVFYAEDAPESLKEMAREEGFNFPFLFDAGQGIAKSFTAMATPDIFIFDRDRALVYRGQFDDSRPKSGVEATGRDVRDAMDAVLAEKPVSKNQKPAVGCSIKWISDSVPKYAQ